MKYPILACLLAAVVTSVRSETIHGIVVFTRHGDRTPKFYEGYEMTNLGATQVYSSGSFYRARYIEDDAPHKILNVSPDMYTPSQLWASAPDQSILLHTATSFLQGLYPPLETLNSDLAIETLPNGSATTSPLNGYQFIPVHGESDQEPDTIWLKGDDACPVYTEASNSYRDSVEYLSILNSSREFYSGLANLLSDIMPVENITYAHAYDIFDLLNVASIHNASTASNATPDQLSQFRHYAAAHELARNFNLIQPTRSIGGMALAGGILRQLNRTIASQGSLKLSLLAGSYDTFLAFFGLTNLTSVNPDFTGLPNYASSMAFELFTQQNVTAFPTQTADLRVRFLFRNGSDSEHAMTPFPLFDRTESSMSYAEFADELGARAINSVGEWCSVCQSTEAFCSLEYASSDGNGVAGASGRNGRGAGLTPLQAGIVGAMTTLAALAVGAAVFSLVRKVAGKFKSRTARKEDEEERGKRVGDSDTECGSTLRP